MEYISLYDRDYLEDARLCGTVHLKFTVFYGRDQLREAKVHPKIVLRSRHCRLM